MRVKALFLSLFILFQALAALAYAASPMGNWQTIDDVTGKPKGIVKVYGSADNLSGVVVKTLPGALTTCTACHGRMKDKPIAGMRVMWGLKQNMDSPNEWDGGTIFDPKTAQTYRCKLTVSPNGRTMEVRGYVGISLLGRSQTWIRMSK